VTIPWKFYLLFGHHIIDGISKSRYMQQIPQFALAHVRFWFSGKYLFFVNICETRGTIYLLCFCFQW